MGTAGMRHAGSGKRGQPTADGGMGEQQRGRHLLDRGSTRACSRGGSATVEERGCQGRPAEAKGLEREGKASSWTARSPSTGLACIALSPSTGVASQLASTRTTLASPRLISSPSTGTPSPLMLRSQASLTGQFMHRSQAFLISTAHGGEVEHTMEATHGLGGDAVMAHPKM
ncbi:hypothetical protein GOP47_0022501 [Adiantum capillus-veneris]|uniref:Uncharacterized protein n=1 Tax=Adiantum capillus-veneris TaxID=13818 RepID=A0A9D4U6K9_ADICA|nr:hypothetical protein GOP47_0022501 [Adiantum capillus-veneris]